MSKKLKWILTSAGVLLLADVSDLAEMFEQNRAAFANELQRFLSGARFADNGQIGLVVQEHP